MSTIHDPAPALKHVLIIKMGAAGDVLMATPLLSALHAAHPGIFVTWVVEEAHAPLLAGNPLIGRLLTIRSSRWRRLLREVQLIPWLRETRHLRSQIYRGAAGPVDAAICCHAEQGIWAALLQGTPIRIGLFPLAQMGLQRRIYTQAIGWPQRVPPIRHTEHYLFATRALGCPDAGEQLLLPETPDEQPFRDEFYRTHAIEASQPRIVVAPFTTWATKEWEPDRWAALIDWLAARHGTRIILTMTAGDRDAAQNIVGMTAPATRNVLISAEGTTLRQYVALIRGADLVISPDSCALHIAAAVKTPSITLFGPTDPAEIAPVRHVSGRILVHPLKCSPCNKMQCVNPTFRLCMKSISLADVQEEVTRMLGAAGATQGESLR